MAAPTLDQAPLWDHQLFSEGSISSVNSQDRSTLTVVTVAARAVRAAAAARVDVGHHALAEPSRVVAIFDLADEFVAEDPAIVHVPARELDVRVADACEPDAHEGLALSSRRKRRVGAVLQDAIKNKCVHQRSVTSVGLRGLN